MTVEAEDHHLRCREAQHRLRDQVADLQARNDRLCVSIEAHAILADLAAAKAEIARLNEICDRLGDAGRRG